MTEPYYQTDDGRITIYHADCRDVLPTLEDGAADCVITDPPYGIAHKSNGQWFMDAQPCSGDGNTLAAQYACEWAGRLSIPLACFFSPYVSLWIEWRSVLVWAKGSHVGIGGDRETCWKRDFELIGVRGNRPLNGKRDSAVLRYNAVLPPPSGHFCEKPVPLMVYLIGKLSDPEHAILDPFMGSGTTLVAAQLEGRRAIGIELDEKWCAVAARRLSQGVLFTPEATDA
jgi:site-specific DNA-methyltransferase (adenine-specific)